MNEAAKLFKKIYKEAFIVDIRHSKNGYYIVKAELEEGIFYFRVNPNYNTISASYDTYDAADKKS